MAIRAVIFDVGGVLLHLRNEARRQSWEARFGLDDGAIARALWTTDVSAQATLGRVSSEAVWASLGATLRLSAEQVAQIEGKYFDDEYLDPSMAALLDELRPHYRLALLTNAWSDARSALTERFALDRLVDDMIISAEVGYAKPDPAIYLLTLERLGVAPHEALFVDDKARNTIAAEALGIASIVFHDAAHDIATIRQRLVG